LQSKKKIIKRNYDGEVVEDEEEEDVENVKLNSRSLKATDWISIGVMLLLIFLMYPSWVSTVCVYDFLT
jgi:hypothetical protein